MNKTSLIKLSMLGVTVLGLGLANVQNTQASSNDSKTSTQKTAKKVYQNPKRYHQISSKRIKPYGKVGHDIGVGYEGIKTYKVSKRLGTYTGHNIYTTGTKYAV